jgi:GT2 family glycosyltransferase
LKISVVIIAKNAQETIRYPLNSLRNQSRKPDEIAVVVPSTEDRTKEALPDYPEVRLVIDKKATRGSARALGVMETSGDIIAFIDAECVADPDWLRVFEATFLEKKEILAQGGPILRIRDLNQPQEDSLPSKEPIRNVKFVPTANFCFRREVVNIIGNFDDRLHEGEDLDFCARLSEHNISLALNLNAIIYHLDRTTFALIKRYFNYGKSRAKVFFKHKRFVFSAALVAAAHIILIPVFIWALIVQRYDIALVAVGLPLLHQVYKFLKTSGWQKHDLSITEFMLDLILTYSLYASFSVYFYYFLVPRNRTKTSTKLAVE